MTKLKLYVSASAVALLATFSAAQAAILNAPVPTNAYITFGGLN
jgi:hypothetical protein